MPTQNTIVLLSPQIPHNTGSIARLCAVTNTILHLVGDMGFELSDKYLKRAGLDYWKYVEYEHFEDIDNYIAHLRWEDAFLFSTKTTQKFTTISYPTPSILLFGNETEGTPSHIQRQFDTIQHIVRIPMKKAQRCINLSVSVGIGLYEVLRQQHFSNLV